MFKHKLIKALLLFSLMASYADAQNLYKYEDDQGLEITLSRVPAEFVKNGYQILNERGQVIEVVARTLTGDELAAQSEMLAEQRLSEQARIDQEEADTILLRLYRSPEEVIRRRDATIEELDGQLSVLTSLLANEEENVSELELRVSNNETAGNAVPANLLSQVESAIEERDRLARQVARIETEKVDVISTAQVNIDRLKELLNLE